MKEKHKKNTTMEKKADQSQQTNKQTKQKPKKGRKRGVLVNDRRGKVYA